MIIPHFNDKGVLPPGDYQVTVDDIRNSYLVTGAAMKSSWDVNWRKRLVNNLEKLVKQLWNIGIERIFINGSFVEEKDHPNDIDGYFECDLRYFATGKLAKDLNFQDPGIWTWKVDNLSAPRNSVKRQLPMWLVYRVELYPHFGQTSGITDRFGHELQFPSAFRQRRGDDEPKGILRLIKE